MNSIGSSSISLDADIKLMLERVGRLASDNHRVLVVTSNTDLCHTISIVAKIIMPEANVRFEWIGSMGLGYSACESDTIYAFKVNDLGYLPVPIMKKVNLEVHPSDSLWYKVFSHAAPIPQTNTSHHPESIWQCVHRHSIGGSGLKK